VALKLKEAPWRDGPAQLVRSPLTLMRLLEALATCPHSVMSSWL
jgi:hypothetical protein